MTGSGPVWTGGRRRRGCHGSRILLAGVRSGSRVVAGVLFGDLAGERLLHRERTVPENATRSRTSSTTNRSGPARDILERVFEEWQSDPEYPTLFRVDRGRGWCLPQKHSPAAVVNWPASLQAWIKAVRASDRTSDAGAGRLPGFDVSNGGLAGPWCWCRPQAVMAGPRSPSRCG